MKDCNGQKCALLLSQEKFSFGSSNMSDPHHSHPIRLFLLVEELHIGVKHVSLGHVNTFAQYLMHQLHHSRGDGNLPDLP